MTVGLTEGVPWTPVVSEEGSQVDSIKLVQFLQVGLGLQHKSYLETQ